MENATKSFFQRDPIRRILLALLFFVSLFSILATSLKPEKFDLVAGQRAPVDINSPKDIEDKFNTELLREKAVANVEPIYKLNPGVRVEVNKDIEKFFNLVYKLQNAEEQTEQLTEEESEEATEEATGKLSEEEKIERLNLENDLNIGIENSKTAIKSSIDDLKYLESYINEIVAQNMNLGINIEDLQKQKSSIKEYITNLNEFNEELKDLAIAVINATIRPNKFLDEEATNGKIDIARENIDKVIIRKGDSIIREGEVVTYDRLEILSDLGILREDNKIDFILYIGIASIVLVIEFIIIAYMMVFNKSLLEKPKMLMMIYLIFMTVVIISKAIEGISIYLIPIAAAAMLISILVDSRLAVLTNLCLTVVISLITGNNISFMAMALIGGTVGAFSVINSQQRSNIFVSGVAISIINMGTIAGIGFINSSEVSQTLTFGLYGLLNGLFSSILAVGSLPLWESVFDVVTPLKLLELSNPNQPLLKKLLIEAPGTYQHSIIVGNLSESAADAIGGNSLLVRAGAFYHDIGKTKRPYFFKENQLTTDNPHDKLKPALSASIITDHVRDGIELAKKHKLPVEIRNFIAEHHGDTLVAYFYHKAKTGENGDQVDEKNFKYDGPKPQSKETAIVMMADSIEAAVRSLSSPSQDDIETLIEKIIDGKLRSGQLDECNITFKELNTIKKTFLKVILSIFHERIEYPDMDIKKEDGGKPHGAVN